MTQPSCSWRATKSAAEGASDEAVTAEPVTARLLSFLACLGMYDSHKVLLEPLDSLFEGVLLSVPLFGHREIRSGGEAVTTPNPDGHQPRPNVFWRVLDIPSVVVLLPSWGVRRHHLGRDVLRLFWPLMNGETVSFEGRRS